MSFAFRPSNRYLEWLFAFMWLAWGFWLLLPFETFANPQYAELKNVMSEEAWGAFSVAFAFARIAVLIINGRWRRTPAWRCIFAILGMCWIVSLIYLYRHIDISHAPAGFAWYPVWMVAELFNAIRAASDSAAREAFSLDFLRGPNDTD